MLLKILSEKGMFKNNMILTCLQKKYSISSSIKRPKLYDGIKNYFYYLI